MADTFPDLSSKLGAPVKKSLFERQKAEAEAKKAREKAETAAVYEDFVKSFDDDEGTNAANHLRPSRHSGTTSIGSTFSAAPGKRHFTSVGLKSGPGSLGPTSDVPKSGPGSLGSAPSTHGRKRPYEAFQGQRRDRERNHGIFNYDDDRPAEQRRHSDNVGSGFQADEEEKVDYNESKAAAKPTLHLSSLPPGTSPAVIRALFIPSPLTIEDIRILPPLAPSRTERKSTIAIVTLAPDTPATDIDTVVSHLQNRYLGFGFKLSISRHLSSAALAGASAISAPSGSFNNLPFGARAIPQHTSLSRAPPPPGQGPGRFAPPASYNSSTPYSARTNMPPSQVTVQSPTDLNQLKMIHKTIEGLLTYGPEFEALLMSRPRIQREEKWAWLWDSGSVGGVYYRWRLWDVLTNGSARRRKQRSNYFASNIGETLFEGQSSWIFPEQGLKFEYTTKLDEFISDEDYDSSDEEADNDGGIAGRYNDHNNMARALPLEGIADANEGLGYLNPLSKAKLVHLLSRLPDANTKLRKGDVARITSFAIEHAGVGADEVAELITRNVAEPMCFSVAKDQNDNESDDKDTDAKDVGEDSFVSGKKDQSSASLVGLYIISDILSSSASAGVRHAWRYRAIFETILRERKVFEALGRLDRTLGWGKLKAEKWKRSVQSILSLWEGWCVFPQTSQEEFANTFANPPLTAKEKMRIDTEEKQKAGDEDEDRRRTKSSNKWRSVEDKENTVADMSAVGGDVDMADIDGLAMTDDDDDAADGEAMDQDEDVDGVSMADSSEEEIGQDGEAEESLSLSVNHSTATEPVPTPPPARKQRMRAVDMFADDSDAE